jgi:UDP-2,3-diacylglucosamine pyrophosphatase LpxH
MQARKVDVAVISDVHLGTYGCHASELVQYLKSIDPEILILNGDIIDIWAFRKKYFPPSHMQVIKEITSKISKGTQVYYITGNHDEMLRRYSGFNLGNFHLDDKLILDLDGRKAWIFHGDVFDASTKGAARWLAKLGGKGYDILILLNRLINRVLELFGREKMSFSKKVKQGVKRAVSWIQDFEQCAAELAIDREYDYVICGHIHQPQDRVISTSKGDVRYLNSGDWVENLSSLEYYNSAWHIYRYENESETKQVLFNMTKKHPAPDVFNNPVELLLHTLSA